MSNSTVGEAAIAVVRRNTEEVQGKGHWALFEELIADDFVDHTPQLGVTADKDGVRHLYKALRAAFPDFHPEIHWQVAAGDEQLRVHGIKGLRTIDASIMPTIINANTMAPMIMIAEKAADLIREGSSTTD